MFTHDLDKIAALTEMSTTAIKEIEESGMNRIRPIHPTLPVPSLSEVVPLSPAQLDIRPLDSVDISCNKVQSRTKEKVGTKAQ
jgi:hypothetical protein